MKRLADFVISGCGVVLLSPVIGLLGLLVRVFLGSPVLFRQIRPGLGGKPFGLVKFRTMTDRCDQYGDLLPDAERLTRFGTFLRSTSLDELPELWNVVRADMSLVGPRPLLMEYLPRYSPVQARRHEIRPGLTGLAQVKGRNDLSWEEKFDLDIWYVDNHDSKLDWAIIFWTIKTVITRQGVSSKDSATVPRFNGTH
ncbi:MAG: sugar transferase [Candidatus Nanopelagicales bacterium]|nr:sugar transferase [Candidatus Nanopelagicales bacterium]